MTFVHTVATGVVTSMTVAKNATDVLGPDTVLELVTVVATSDR